MEIQASAKFTRLSPTKARPLARTLRGLPTTDALNKLKYHNSKASRVLYKLIHSAVSNAKNNYNFKEDNLKIKQLLVNAGPSYKRYWLRSHGSADKLLKRTSHLYVTLTEIKPTVVKKPVAKPRVAPPVVEDSKPDTVTPPPPPIDKSPGPQAAKPKTGLLKRIFTRRTTNK